MRPIRFASAALALLVTACGGEQALVAKPGESLIVFLRPSTLTPAVNYQPIIGMQRPVLLYEVATKDFVGQLGVGEKLAHTVKPGMHRFLLVGGRSGHPAAAEVLAGRTYYFLITQDLPTGLQNPMQARYEIRAVRRSELDGRNFSHWVGNTVLVTRPDSAPPRPIRDRQFEQYSGQLAHMAPEQRAARTLQATDGR